MARGKYEQRENDERDHRNHHVGQDSFAARRAALLPDSMFFPVAYSDLFRML
jgi:hypothetical protein